MGWNKVIVSGSRAELLSLTASATAPLRVPNIGTDSSRWALVVDSNNNVFKASTQFDTGTVQTLNTGSIYIGNSVNIAEGRTLAGDATISVSGSLTLSGSAIGNKTELSTVAGSEYLLVLDGTVLKKTLASNVGSRTGSFTGSFTGSIRANLPNTQIFVGNASGIATPVAMSGDVTIVANGATTIGAQKVLASMLETSIVNNLTAHESNTLNLTQTQFFVSSGSSFLNRKLTYNQLLNDIRPILSTGSFTGSLNGELTSVFLTGNNIWTGDLNNRAVITPVNGDITYSNISGLFTFKSNYLSTLNNAWASNGSPLPPTNGNELQFFIGSGSGLTNSPFTYNQLTGSLSASFAASGLLNPGVGTYVSGPTPATTTTNAISVWLDTNGRDIKNTGVIIDGSNNITGVNDLTVNNNLYVNGTLTTINTDNLQVEDRFILLNSGSNVATPHSDAGFILQTTTTNGIMFGYDASTGDGSSLGRFGIKTNSLNTDNGFTSDPDAFVATVEVGVSPPTEPILGGTQGKGATFVDNSGDIWIWS